MAGENCLWGAPRIHGELLKLGFTISERTVSRYLRGRPTTRSQTWRTFFANHFAGQTFISPVMFADTDDEDIVVDASDVSLRPVQPIDASYASIHGPTVDWRYSRQLSSLGVILGQHPLQGRTGARKSSGRDPPPRLPFQPASWHLRGFSFVRGDTASATDGSVRSTAARDRPFAVLSLSSKNNQVVNVVGRPALQSAWCPRCDLRGSKYWRTTARSRTAGSSQDRDRGKECSRIWEFAILEAFGIPIRTAYLRGTDAASQCLL